MSVKHGASQGGNYDVMIDNLKANNVASRRGEVEAGGGGWRLLYPDDPLPVTRGGAGHGGAGGGSAASHRLANDGFVVHEAKATVDRKNWELRSRREHLELQYGDARNVDQDALQHTRLLQQRKWEHQQQHQRELQQQQQRLQQEQQREQQREQQALQQQRSSRMSKQHAGTAVPISAVRPNGFTVYTTMPNVNELSPRRGFGGGGLNGSYPGGAVSNGYGAPGGAVSNGHGAPGGAVSNGYGAPGGAVSNGHGAPVGAVSNGYAAPVGAVPNDYGAPGGAVSNGQGAPGGAVPNGYGAPGGAVSNGYGAPGVAVFHGYGDPRSTQQRPAAPSAASTNVQFATQSSIMHRPPILRQSTNMHAPTRDTRMAGDEGAYTGRRQPSVKIEQCINKVTTVRFS